MDSGSGEISEIRRWPSEYRKSGLVYVSHEAWIVTTDNWESFHDAHY
jgi:hypothetical protein